MRGIAIDVSCGLKCEIIVKYSNNREYWCTIVKLHFPSDQTVLGGLYKSTNESGVNKFSHLTQTISNTICLISNRTI